jgi:hypothetical protein
MLVQDPFGNYVVQYVLGLQDPQASSAIIHSMLGHLNVLSRQKFSSNVVERCLQLSNPEDKELMILELCDMRGLGELLKDVYGNYVVQSALNGCEEPLLSVFLNAVRPLLPSMRTNGQGRRIAQKLEKKYPQLRGPATSYPNVGGGIETFQQPRGCGNGLARPSPPQMHFDHASELGRWQGAIGEGSVVGNSNALAPPAPVIPGGHLGAGLSTSMPASVGTPSRSKRGRRKVQAQQMS